MKQKGHQIAVSGILPRGDRFSKKAKDVNDCLEIKCKGDNIKAFESLYLQHQKVYLKIIFLIVRIQMKEAKRSKAAKIMILSLYLESNA